MKQLFTVSFLFISIFFSAQIWVKPNATWHYDFSTISSGGFMKIQHIADTVIESKNAMVLETTMYEFIAGQNGTIHFSFSDTLNRNYTYVNGDTVFYWRNNKFEVLYNFSEVAGGGWMLGAESEEMNMCDDTSTVDVISEGIVNISGTNYKSLTLKSNDSSPYRFDGKFNERFGAYEGDYSYSPWRYLFPRFASCNPGISVEYYSYSFKCFQDDELFYNPSGEDCEYYLTYLGLSDFDKKPLNVYPNPASESIYLNLTNNLEYSIFDSTGKLCLNGKSEGNQINIEKLNKGTYIIVLKDENMSKSRRFVKI
jgi:hypothetical protein